MSNMTNEQRQQAITRSLAAALLYCEGNGADAASALCVAYYSMMVLVVGEANAKETIKRAVDGFEITKHQALGVLGEAIRNLDECGIDTVVVMPVDRKDATVNPEPRPYVVVEFGSGVTAERVAIEHDPERALTAQVRYLVAGAPGIVDGHEVPFGIITAPTMQDALDKRHLLPATYRYTEKEEPDDVTTV